MEDTIKMDEIISRKEYEEICDIIMTEKLINKSVFLAQEFFKNYKLALRSLERNIPVSGSFCKIGSINSSIGLRKNKFFKNVVLKLITGDLFLFRL